MRRITPTAGGCSHRGGSLAFELGRAHLVYGAWLRRDRRRIDARDQLRVAQDMVSAMGAEAFAARTGRDLPATGEPARTRGDDTRDDLTSQKTQVSRPARSLMSSTNSRPVAG